MGIDEFGDAGGFAISRGHRDEFRPEMSSISVVLHRGLVLELIGRLHDDETRAGDQIMRLRVSFVKILLNTPRRLPRTNRV